MKTCNVCHKEKEFSAFCKRTASKDGLAYTCKICSAVAYTDFKDRNPEKGKVYAATYYAKHKKQCAERVTAWKTANKKKVAEDAIALRQRKLSQYLKYEADYRKKNAEIIKAKRHADKEGQRTQSAIKRARKRGAEGKHTKAEIIALRDRQQDRCAVCRTKLDNKYHRDHIIPLVAGGSNWISNIQLLCPRCNGSKKDKHPIAFMQSRGFLL